MDQSLWDMEVLSTIQRLKLEGIGIRSSILRPFRVDSGMLSCWLVYWYDRYEPMTLFHSLFHIVMKFFMLYNRNSVDDTTATFPVA